MKRKFLAALKVSAVAALAAVATMTAAAPAGATIPRSPVLAPASQVVTHSGVVRANGVHPMLAWKSYSWGNLYSGDCTMYSGATWTLYSDGHATFDGTVHSTDDNDAWLMYLHLKDASGAEIGQLDNAAMTDPFAPNKFVENLGSSDTSYRWFASGFFSSSQYNVINGMSMSHSC